MNTTQQADCPPFSTALQTQSLDVSSLVPFMDQQDTIHRPPIWLASREHGSTLCSLFTTWNEHADATIWADGEKESTLFFSRKKVTGLAFAFRGLLTSVVLPEPLPCYSYQRNAALAGCEGSVWIATVFGFLLHDLRLVYRLDRSGITSVLEKQSVPLKL